MTSASCSCFRIRGFSGLPVVLFRGFAVHGRFLIVSLWEGAPRGVDNLLIPTVDGQNPALPIIRNIPKFP